MSPEQNSAFSEINPLTSSSLIVTRGQSWEDAAEQHPSCKPKRCHGSTENHHEPWSIHGLIIEVVTGKKNHRNQLRCPWEVREPPCIATAHEVKGTSTSQNCPSTSWILATLRLCKWCDLVIYHKLDNLLHVWMICRPARQVSEPFVAFLTDPDLEYQSILIVFGSSLQMKIDKKERNLLAVSTGWDGRDTHQAGW